MFLSRCTNEEHLRGDVGMPSTCTASAGRHLVSGISKALRASLCRSRLRAACRPQRQPRQACRMSWRCWSWPTGSAWRRERGGEARLHQCPSRARPGPPASRGRVQPRTSRRPGRCHPVAPAGLGGRDRARPGVGALRRHPGPESARVGRLRRVERLGGGRHSRRRGLMEPVILDEEGRDRRGPATLRADEAGRDSQPCRRARMAPLQGLANMNCRGPRSGADQIGRPLGAKRPRRRPPEGLSP